MSQQNNPADSSQPTPQTVSFTVKSELGNGFTMVTRHHDERSAQNEQRWQALAYGRVAEVVRAR